MPIVPDHVSSRANRSLPPSFAVAISFPFLSRVARLAALGITFLFLGERSSSVAQETSDGRFSKPLVVGAGNDSYPYSYITNEGRCEGFAVEVLDAVARVMDIKIQRVLATGPQLENRFKSGDFDLLQLYSQSTLRDSYAEFSVSVLNLQGSYFVRRDDTRFHRLTDLRDKDVLIIGVHSLAEKVTRDQPLNLHILYADSVDDALRKLEQGKADAVFATRLSALSAIKHYKLRNIRALTGPTENYDLRHCFAVHKGDAALLARLNEGLAVLHRTGEFDEIYRRWFNQLETPLFTREQVITYAAIMLACACLAAMWGLVRQRALHRRLAGQTAQLAENESILAEAQQIAHVGHYRYDVASKQLTCSAEALRIIDYTTKQSPPTFFKIFKMISRSERPIARQNLRDALQKGRNWDLVVTLHPNRRTRKIIHTSVRAVRDSSNAVVALFGTLQDITLQKTAEENLRARERLLRALYENVPSAMGVVEPDGQSFRFISANPGTMRLLGLNATGVLADKILSELPLPTATVEFWSHWFSQGAAQNEILKTEFQLDSTRRYYAITLVPLDGSGSGRKQIYFLVDDITERKQMDAEIAQGRRLRAVGELVGGIAHEFNNLLTPIMLKIDLLAYEWRSDPRMLEELHTITLAAQRGADLTRRLLAFGRRSEARHEEVHLETIVSANFDLLRPTVDRRIRLEVDLSKNLPALFLDPSDLHQIVLNLLLNARDTLVEKIEHSPSDSWHARIRVEAATFGSNAPDAPLWNKPIRPTGWLCLIVRDNGMGMPREVLERIFEPFYTTKEVGKGTGLGLATVWHLVTRIGGKVTVSSSAGDGSNFHVWLPVLPEEPAAAPKPALTTEPKKVGAKILLVEDDELVAKTVLAALKRHDHVVTHYANGVDAWRHLSANFAYDLLLLDLDLPGISGLEIVRRARANQFAGKILVASGRLTDQEERELTEWNVDGKLGKPFTIHTLQEAVLACLRLPSEQPQQLNKS